MIEKIAKDVGLKNIISREKLRILHTLDEIADNKEESYIKQQFEKNKK
jgi:hypothetical protein